MNKFIELLKRADFKFHPITFLPLLFLLLTYPAILYLPVYYAFENNILENIQLIVITITFILCLKAKVNKKFFISLALVCTIIFIREINFGRTIFFPIPWEYNSFYPWKEIPFGFLAEPIEGLYIVFCGLYFIFTKSYKVFFNYLTKAKIPVWNTLLLIIGIILSAIGEKTGAYVLEEMSENTLYFSILTFIYLYGHNKKYIDTNLK